MASILIGYHGALINYKSAAIYLRDNNEKKDISFDYLQQMQDVMVESRI